MFCHVKVRGDLDRKSTRLNSSHGYISYAGFCLKKKKYFGKQRWYGREVKCTLPEYEAVDNYVPGAGVVLGGPALSGLAGVKGSDTG